MKELLALEARIERLSRGPDGIDAPFVRLMRPILARLGYTPNVSAESAQLLLHALSTRIDPAVPPSLLDEEALFRRAVIELRENVENVERLTVIRKKPLVAYAAWLRRLFEVLVHAGRWLESGGKAPVHAELATARSAVVLPPLAVVAQPVKENASAAPPPPQPTRLLELDLAAVDHVLAEATDEVEVLGRRRRLLETARQLLLDVSAALPLDEKGVEARRRHIAKEITRIDRLVAAGVSPDATLTHQLRQTMARGERSRLHAILVARDGTSLGAGDADGHRKARSALNAMWKKKDGAKDERARRASLAKSAEELFGREFVERARKIYDRQKRRGADLAASEDDLTAIRGATMTGYFGGAAIEGLLAAQVSVDGAFEVGGALLPMRIEEVEKRWRAVRFPTEELLLLPANEPNDIPDAAVDDPRTILLDLAAGRLLARRFVHEEKLIHHRTVLRGEVRIYVLDGSGSMLGPRGRMRDAIVAAELLTLRRRFLEGAKHARVSFFYRWFDSVVHPTTRVLDLPSIDKAIEDVLGGLREGGTDIETAIVLSMRQIAEARGSDPELAQAQIVLVTDGEATVSEERVEAIRKGIGIPVGFSVIALGQQNPALRRLVANQRARGERAFYHFIPDDALAAIAKGTLDDGLAIHLSSGSAVVDPRTLESEVGEVVDEIVQLGRTHEVAALEALDDQSAANFDLGIDESSLTEGERARARALYRDRRALERQFLRWFPKPLPNAAPPGLELTDPHDVEATMVVLASVVDVVAVVMGSELARRADAIAILERLLPDAELTPARYLAVVAHPPARVAKALAAVHAATTPPA